MEEGVSKNVCEICLSEVTESCPIYHCLAGQHAFCQACLPSQSPCVLCSEGTPPICEALVATSETLPVHPIGVNELRALKTPYKNRATVPKMTCKYREYGCSRHLQIHLFDKHVRRCRFRYKPYSCPICDVYIPLPSLPHSNLSPVPDWDHFGDNGETFDGRKYLLTDKDPLWGGGIKLVKDRSHRILRMELRRRLLLGGHSARPEFTIILGSRISDITYGVVSDL